MLSEDCREWLVAPFVIGIAVSEYFGTIRDLLENRMWTESDLYQCRVCLAYGIQIDWICQFSVGSTGGTVVLSQM